VIGIVQSGAEVGSMGAASRGLIKAVPSEAVEALLREGGSGAGFACE
jgi:hypothetical protein